MKQNIDVLKTVVAVFRRSVEIIFGFGAENSSNEKGDSKRCK